MDRLADRNGEIRAFVSDHVFGLTLKERGVKVAIGDVSDPSHIGGASLGCFSAILIPDAAFDDRMRSFSTGPAETIESWAEAMIDAKVNRVIWVEDDSARPHRRFFDGIDAQFMTIDRTGASLDEVAESVVAADDAGPV